MAPVSHGERTLSGFQTYMQSGTYKEGLDELIKITQKHPEHGVALTCAEGKEDDCHRKFILEDLRKRLGVEKPAPKVAQLSLLGDKP